jgi:hypothetical protein
MESGVVSPGTRPVPHCSFQLQLEEGKPVSVAHYPWMGAVQRDESQSSFDKSLLMKGLFDGDLKTFWHAELGCLGLLEAGIRLELCSQSLLDSQYHKNRHHAEKSPANHHRFLHVMLQSQFQGPIH